MAYFEKYFCICKNLDQKKLIALIAPYSSCWLSPEDIVEYVDDKGDVRKAVIGIVQNSWREENDIELMSQFTFLNDGKEPFHIIRKWTSSEVNWPEDVAEEPEPEEAAPEEVPA